MRSIDADCSCCTVAGVITDQVLSKNFSQLQMRSQAKQMFSGECSLDAQVLIQNFLMVLIIS